MKKLSSLVIGMACIFSLILCAGFTPPIEKSSQEPVLESAYRATANGLVKLNDTEFQTLKNELNSNMKNDIDNNAANNPQITTDTSNDIDSKGLVADWSVFNKTGSVAKVDRPSLQKRVSAYVKNYGTGNMTKTLSSASSQSYTINIGITNALRDAITASLGTTWNRTLTYSDSTSITVLPGYKGWMEFYPIMKNAYGYYDTYNGVTSVRTGHVFTNIYSVIKLSDTSIDGVYLGYSSKM